MIEFPGLWGLQFNIDPVALKLGNIYIFWYGVIIAVGFALSVILAVRNSRKFGIDSEIIVDLVLWATIPAIIFARLYYVIFNWSEYQGDFYKIINIREGGIAIYGALIGAVLAGLIFSRYKKINPLKLFDFAIPYFILAQSIGRWGNFVNQEAYGVNTTLPWGMTSDKIQKELSMIEGQNPNIPVHPTFLYESLWDFLCFLALIWFRKRKKVNGEVFFLYMILYGLGRSVIEGLRTDSLFLGSFRISQVLGIIFVITFTIIFFVRRKNFSDTSDEEVETGSSKYGSVIEAMRAEDEAEPETQDETINTDEKCDSASQTTDDNVGHEPDSKENSGDAR